MGRDVGVPDALRRKAAAEGRQCVQWLAGLPDLLDEFERDWEVVVGEAIAGGTASFVSGATTSDGTRAVIKLAMPASLDGQEALDREVRTLLAADGRGCVRVLAHDPDRAAVLLERLGAPLAEAGLPLSRQLAIICRTLRDLWAVPADPELPSGAEKARWLASFIATTWEQLGRPCPEHVVDHALDIVARRLAGHAESAIAPPGPIRTGQTQLAQNFTMSGRVPIRPPRTSPSIGRDSTDGAKGVLGAQIRAIGAARPPGPSVPLQGPSREDLRLSS